MSFCRECGEEVQNDWVACPCCRAVLVKETGNNILWNLVIIAATIVILMWPSGIADITLLERAFFDCSHDIFAILDLDDGCKEWRGEGQFIVFLVFAIFILALMINNPRLANSNTENKKKRLEAQRALDEKRAAKKAERYERVIAKAEEAKKAEEARAKAALVKEAKEKGFNSVEAMQKFEQAEETRLILNVIVTILFFTIIMLPTISTYSLGPTVVEGDQVMGWVGDTTASIHEIATCEINEAGSSETNLYCPSKSYRSEYIIAYACIIASYFVLMWLINTGKAEKNNLCEEE